MFTFNHFNFNVLDLERSVRFYHDLCFWATGTRRLSSS